MLILLLPLLELGSKSNPLNSGFCRRRPRQYDMICLDVGSNFCILCFLLFDCFEWMESINVAGVLKEAGDADSRAYTKSQVSEDYFIIPFISTFVRLSYLYQECHVHCIVIKNDVGIG